MTITTWKSKYELGIKSVDDDHKILVQLMNDLEIAMLFGRGKDALPNILENLINYTSMHFSREEQLMQECHYAELASHKNEHALFLKKILALQHDFKGGDIGAPTRMLNVLREWLEQHLLQSDRKFVACFKEHGL